MQSITASKVSVLGNAAVVKPPGTEAVAAAAPPKASEAPAAEPEPEPAAVAATAAGGASEEVAEEVDMFSAQFDAAAAEAAATGFQQKHKDNFDDDQGYYRIRVGESLGGRYKVYGFTGQGVFSNVLRARDSKDSDAPVAIKMIRNNDLMHKAGLKEIEILQRIMAADRGGKHNCVRFMHSFEHKNHLCMVFESCSMNLREVTKKFGRSDGEVVGLNMRAVQQYAHQLLMSLKLMRKCSVLHGDLKPDNILVNEQKSQAKLCDFGSACLMEEAEVSPYIQSRFYRAPEVILGHRFDYGMDMWALGATLFELYTGRILFQGRDNNGMLREMFELKGLPAKAWARKGKFFEKHYDLDGNFTYFEFDAVTKRPKARTMQPQPPSQRLQKALLATARDRRDEGERSKILQFHNLLDQMLAIVPEKRITPREALAHPFITERIIAGP